MKQAVVHESLTAWRSGQQAGLQFLNTVDLGGETPLRYRAIQKVWVELMPR
jgi:hypothetical protein